MTAADALQGVSRLLLDTNALIPLIERYPQDPTWVLRNRKAWSVVEVAVQNSIELLVSPITLTEVCSKPGLTHELLLEYQAFCQGTEGVRFEPIQFNEVYAYRVGNIGRTHGLQAADSFQVAFAETFQCGALLTNDERLAKRSPIRGIRLDDLELV